MVPYSTSELNLFKNTPITRITIFLIMIIAAGTGTFLIAVDLMGVDRNYAFGGSIGMMALLVAVFKHYLKK